jgi:hypothetical protein
VSQEAACALHRARPLRVVVLSGEGIAHLIGPSLLKLIAKEKDPWRPSISPPLHRSLDP